MPWTVKIANSKFSEGGGGTQKMEKKVPKLALTFSNPAEGSVMLATKEGEEPKLQILAYSGGIIKNHWMWGDLAIDLTGMKFSDTKYPVLESHDTSKKIAFIKKPKVRDHQLVVNGGTFVDTEASQEFQKLSKQGFPYQASIYANPTIIEQVGDDEKVEVNGYKFKGPGTVWRKCEFREVSVCVFGWDKKTKSEALGEVELSYDTYTDTTNIRGEEVKEPMNLEQLKEKDQEGYNKLVAEVKDEVKEEVKTELQEEHDKEKSELSVELKDVRKELETSGEKMKELEKKETIRAEKEIQMTNEKAAEDIWTEKLADSDLSDNAKNKLPDYVDPKKFLKDDGTLDSEAFGKAVETEIKYWTEEVGATKTVLGMASTQKSVDEDENLKKSEKEDDDWAANMVALAGEIRQEQTT